MDMLMSLPEAHDPSALDRYDTWPAGLEDVWINDIRRVLPRPSLIHIEGEKTRPLFLSLLLHGNETTSFHILQTLARTYRRQKPHRSLMIFVGNVYAAEKGVRTLSGQIDFNRIWGDPLAYDSSEYGLAHKVLNAARQANLFASVDIHNTTGQNPAYGCVNTMREEDMAMASLFSNTGVYYQNPATTQSIAFSKLCPSLIIECGQSGSEEGLEAAKRLVNQLIALDTLPRNPAQKMQLFETIGRVVLPDGARVGVNYNEGADIILPCSAEDWNFRTLEEGNAFMTVAQQDHGVSVVDEHGNDLTNHFFNFEDNRLVLMRDLVPAMLTLDTTAIQQDCLCYLMRPL